MSDTRRNRIPRLAALLAVGLAALLLSGCSLTARKVYSGVSQDQLSAGVEPYFNVGGVTYQIQESRQLNPFSDDVQYFAGVKNAQKIPANMFWYGVFVWAKNQNKSSMRSAGRFTLTDSAGNVYQPETLNSNVNPFAWTSLNLQQNEIQPDQTLDPIAASGTTDGDLVLFELPNTVYQNRPLTLHVYAPGASQGAAVSLDL